MIYFDNAATTPPISSPEIFYNPSSPHALGIKAERALRDARKTITAALGLTANPLPSPDEITFTSGGTESNNLAILGYTLANMRHSVNLISAPHEHPSILAPIRFAQERGWATGETDLKANCEVSGANLICISHVNHETGDINDIGTIAKEIKKNNPSAIIHVDGAQGFCKEPISLHDIDMYSFSGHKCHGPTGTGGLWVRKGLRLTPFMHGGGQENHLRAGTENVAAIAQMAEAAKTMSQQLQTNHTHVAKLKTIMLGLQNTLPDVHVNALCESVSPYILNMSFTGIKGEILVHALSEKGIYVSMGAACNSRKRAPSALEVMGFSPEIAKSAIRFSFSPLNHVSEAEQAHDIVAETVKRLRHVIRK